MVRIDVSREELYWIKGGLEYMVDHLLDYDSFGNPKYDPMNERMRALLERITRINSRYNPPRPAYVVRVGGGQ